MRLDIIPDTSIATLAASMGTSTESTELHRGHEEDDEEEESAKRPEETLTVQQRKEHPVWDTTLSLDTRLEDLLSE